MQSEEHAAEPGRAGAKRVALFVTCLVDLVRPSVGFAAVRLLRRAGFHVAVPEAQTCCGQPAYNSGDRADAQAIARRTLDAFQGYDYVVVPSGSCAGMIKVHYPRLFDDNPVTRAKAEDLARRTFELTSFLADVAQLERVESGFAGSATYHDACSGLRELGIKDQPRRLLRLLPGISLRESREAETCCGFGGLFCVKYPEVSTSIVDRKIDDALATGAATLLAGDMGCLLNIAGRLQRRFPGAPPMRVRHVAEVLAGTPDDGAIGEAPAV